MFAIVPRTVLGSGNVFRAKVAGFLGRVGMNRNPTIVALLLASLVSANSFAQTRNIESKSEIVPLDEIWAWKMPGTKNVGTLDAVKIGGTTEHPILRDIFKGFGVLPKGDRAAPAFVVDGVGKIALENARAFFRKEHRRTEEVPANMNLSLIFFSHSAGQYCHLVAVERSERLVTVKYRFVGHASADNTIHFALVPIGKFAPGVVEVKIEQQNSIKESGAERPPIPGMERLVSDSFSFTVHK